MGLKVSGGVAVHLSRRHIIFELHPNEAAASLGTPLIGGIQIVSRLLDGQFMNYHAAIPTSWDNALLVTPDELIAAIARVSLIINEKVKSPIVMELCPESDSIVISCKTGTGEAQERVSVQGCTKAMTIGYNHRYLMEALSACDDDTVKLCIKSATAPTVISPPDGDAYLQMVLPVRLR
jgi:DNA polymerase-3 subunit beta